MNLISGISSILAIGLLSPVQSILFLIVLFVSTAICLYSQGFVLMGILYVLIYKTLKAKVMTFDSCQGEERDNIYYSMVATKEKDKLSSVLGMKFESHMDPEENLRLQRLNVGMSRAKEKITFITSKPVKTYSGNAHLILSHYENEIKHAKSRRFTSF